MSFSLLRRWARNAPEGGIHVTPVDILVPLAWVWLFHTAYAIVALADSVGRVNHVAILPYYQDSETIDFFNLKIQCLI